MDVDTKDASPPAYTANTGPSTRAEVDAAPKYAPSTTCVPFPNVIKACYQRGKIKTFYLCSEDPNERLYAVKIHTGYSGKLPLGSRPGTMLYGDQTMAGPVVAATGDESASAARSYLFNLESIVLIPALPSSKVITMTREGLVTERMRARTLDNGDVGFRFAIEVGSIEEKLRREEFEWRKIDKGTDKEPQGGFRLVRLGEAVPAAPSANAASSSSAASSAPSRSPAGQEVVAVLEFGQRGTGLQLIVRRLGSGVVGGGLGDRWALMVVLTALRLKMLSAAGRTGRRHVAIGQKLYGK